MANQPGANQPGANQPGANHEGADQPGADQAGAKQSRARQVADPDPKVGGIAGERLMSIIQRIERLEEERKALGNDIKDIFAEGKSAGFDVAVLKQLIRLRKKEPAEVEEQESLLDLYKRAIGM